jgi:hypothetical protein
VADVADAGEPGQQVGLGVRGQSRGDGLVEVGDGGQQGGEQLGLGVHEPGEHGRVREDDLELLPAIQAAVAAGIDEDATVRALRVFGASVRRIAETQNQLFHAKVELPLLRSGLSQR